MNIDLQTIENSIIRLVSLIFPILLAFSQSALSQKSLPSEAMLDLTGTQNLTLDHIGDIEGNTELLRQQLDQLLHQGKIFTSSPMALTSSNPIDWTGKLRIAPKAYLIFAGDIGDPLHGPFASETYHFINELRRRQPQQVFSLVGNRELNKLRFLTSLFGEFANIPKINEFSNWVQSSGIDPLNLESTSTRMKFILSRAMGADPAFENHRIAIRDRLARLSNPLNPPISSIPDNLVVASVLLDLMTTNELKKFNPLFFNTASEEAKLLGHSLESIHPQPAALREYIESSQIAHLFKLPDLDVLFTHGSPTGKNIGTVPYGLGAKDIVFHSSLETWVKGLKDFKTKSLKDALNGPVGSSTNLLIEYGSYNYPIKDLSLVTTKSGSATDAMIIADSELIQKVRTLSGNRPVVFVSGHTPGRNAWQSHDSGPRVLRLTNDPSSDRSFSALNLITTNGATTVSHRVTMNVGGQNTNIQILNETPALPNRELRFTGERVVIDSKTYVVIGQVEGASDWLVERISIGDNYKVSRKLVKDREIRFLRIPQRPSCASAVKDAP